VIYVDSNVLIDILDADPDWQGWSQGQLEAARMAGPVVAGAIVAAEVGHFAESAEQVTRWFAALGVALAPASFDAAYRAGQAYRLYKARGGERDTLLADFLVGAEAFALDATLLTRDIRWYRRYFPELKLIHPEADQ